MNAMDSICTDLAEEHAALDQVVAPLDETGWDTPTPAEGWAVRDQISHLGYFDRTATLAARDPDGFNEHLTWALSGGIVGADVEPGRTRSGADLLEWWREGRVALLAALAELDPAARVPWYGPAMSAVSFATARLMETWAHGQDVVDAVGGSRPDTDRLRHVCHIGVRALPFSYRNRGMDVPEAAVRVELRSPSGDLWTWGDEGAENVVRGSAKDFALVVTQRRHRADTGLAAEGPVADEWLSIAQAFAGPPGPGRSPLGAGGAAGAAGGAGAGSAGAGAGPAA